MSDREKDDWLGSSFELFFGKRFTFFFLLSFINLKKKTPSQINRPSPSPRADLFREFISLQLSVDVAALSDRNSIARELPQICAERTARRERDCDGVRQTPRRRRRALTAPVTAAFFRGPAEVLAARNCSPFHERASEFSFVTLNSRQSSILFSFST